MASPDVVQRVGGTHDTAAIFHATSTVTADANGTAHEVGRGGTFDVVVSVRGTVSGTSPTLDVDVETSPDNSTWTTQQAFPQITAAGEYRLHVRSDDLYMRCPVTVGGTSPSFGTTEVWLAA